MFEEALPRQLRQPPPHPLLALRRRQIEQGTAIVIEAEARPRPGQGDTPHHLLDVAQLRLLGPQKLTSGRGVVKEIAHLDRGADGMGGRGRFVEAIATVPADGPGLPGIPGPGPHLQARDRGNAGQGLAPKAQGGHRLQVRQAGDLAGGVATQRQGQVLAGDTGAIVPHPQQLDAPLLQVDLDAIRAGVQAIFNKFLGHGRRPLHHLAGGDLIDELRGQLADAVGDGDAHEGGWKQKGRRLARRP